jgi:hypothetical protein
MAEQFLNGANISTPLQKVRCETMTQHVRVYGSQFCASSNLLHDMTERAAGERAIRLGSH